MSLRASVAMSKELTLTQQGMAKSNVALGVVYNEVPKDTSSILTMLDNALATAKSDQKLLVTSPVTTLTI